MSAEWGTMLGPVLAGAAVFALAGVVKGVVGLGLPTVSMALLALFMPTGQAAAWLLLPSLLTNVLQMRPMGQLGPLWRVLWPMQLGGLMGTLGGMWYWGPLGEAAGAHRLLGAALLAYALWGLWGRPLTIAPRHQRWLGAVVGLVTGGVTALTGVFVLPGVPYLQALGLPRTALMQAMGLSFTLSTLALGVGLALTSGSAAGAGAMPWGQTLWLSAAMLLPALAGMAVGERLRNALSPQVFKRALMGSLLVLGLYMLV